MRRVMYIVGMLALLAGGLAAAGVAGSHGDGTLTISTGTTGHTPVTFCHKPGTPAQKELTTDDDGFLEGHLGHGDTLGPCPETPIDYCDTLDGVQAEDEDCPGPPVDVCENLPGNQPAGTDCNPVVAPPNPNPGHGCAFVGADKDGGTDAYGGTNDDCAPFPSKPVTVTAATVVVAQAAAPVTVAVKPAVAAKPKPKPVAKPKPKAPKPDKPKVVKRHRTVHVCAPLKDGSKRVWVKTAGPTHGCQIVGRPDAAILTG